MKNRILTANIHWKLKGSHEFSDGSFKLPSNHIVYFPGRGDCKLRVSDANDSLENANPAELFLASISSSQMISYLRLCSIRKIPVREYHDHGEIVVSENNRGDCEISKITLKPFISFNCKESASIYASSIRFVNESISHSVIIGALKVPLDVDPLLEFLGE